MHDTTGETTVGRSATFVRSTGIERGAVEDKVFCREGHCCSWPVSTMTRGTADTEVYPPQGVALIVYEGSEPSPAHSDTRDTGQRWEMKWNEQTDLSSYWYLILFSAHLDNTANFAAVDVPKAGLGNKLRFCGRKAVAQKKRSSVKRNNKTTINRKADAGKQASAPASRMRISAHAVRCGFFGAKARRPQKQTNGSTTTCTSSSPFLLLQLGRRASGFFAIERRGGEGRRAEEAVGSFAGGSASSSRLHFTRCGMLCGLASASHSDRAGY